ncbi:carbamoyltransferase C-terminal domain-containing protein [Nocardiopsis sp. JB363]|uniref:carbamoyltransferase family protein n=1 Tax=Nocardiopsis sp. JB363 TaxID=1434837 RepID=UPI00097A6410|nr:carbamoyltransferase C-terminal domain-containing protein [Nocardiopsis sp. JB363]SIO84436.1 Carbamoyltransferase [Nocardiopsis sp. JB363]
MARYYVGLANTLHDSALAVVGPDGRVLFAEANERFLQNKRSINAPPDLFSHARAVIDEHCEPDAELVVAQSWSGRAVPIMQRMLEQLRGEERQLVDVFGEVPDFMRTHFASREYLYAAQISAINQTGLTLKYELNQSERRPYVRSLPVRAYDHHLTHAAAAAYTSPFDEAVCGVLDALGEGTSTACFSYRDGRIQRIDDNADSVAGSLGFFYTFVCVVCGFGHLTGEEWKVMGLAAYGKPRAELYELFRSMIEVDGVDIRFARDQSLLPIFKRLHDIRRRSDESPFAAADLAYAGQQVFTEVYFEFLRNLRELGGSDNLVLGGGCALNSSANGRILANTGYERVHVFSAPGDDGNAVGAALLAHREDHPDHPASEGVQSPYLGSSVSQDTLDKLRTYGPRKQARLDRDELCRRVARHLADGRLVGWAQGRAEFGPRALGNRSILADARDPGMKDKINGRVKFREEFRPFAPSILHEYGDEYFEDYQESPYMERTLRVREDKAAEIPAVVHEDGTSRLQSVRWETNETYYRLLDEFRRITGVPLLLNTSFNVMKKPIVHSVEDMVAVFHTSGLDVLVIGDTVFEK